MEKKFNPLDEYTAALVAGNGKLYDDYVDILMLLQDMLSPLSADRSHQTLQLEYLKERLNKILEGLKYSDYKEVFENVKQNLTSADELVNKAKKIESVQDAHEVQTYVTKFLDELSQMYSLVRNEHKRHGTKPIRQQV